MFGSGSNNPFGPKTSKRKTPPVGGAPVGLFGMPAPSPIGSAVSTQSGFAGFRAPSPGQGSSNQLFGSASTTGFGGNVSTPQFGQTLSSTSPLFGSTATTAPKSGLFSQAPTNTTSLFSAAPSPNPVFSPPSTTSSLFGQPASNPPAQTVVVSQLFGGSGDSSVVRSAGTRPNTPVFGETVVDPITTSSDPNSGLLFGAPVSTATPVFGAPATSSTTASLFGGPTPSGLFGAPVSSTTKSSLFGGPPPSSGTATSLFGGTPNTISAPVTSLFGGPPPNAGTVTSLFGGTPPTTTSPVSSLFGVPPPSTGPATSLFGGTPTTTTTSTLFGAISETGQSKAKKLGATAKFLMQSSTGSTGLFEVNQGTKETLFSGNIEADKTPTMLGGLFSTGQSSTGENLFGSQEPPLFGHHADSIEPIFGSSEPSSVFSGAESSVGSSLFGAKSSKPSVKSRLGTVPAVGDIDTDAEQENVFSKPKLVRTGRFGNPDLPLVTEEKDHSETESEVSDGGTKRRMERTVSREELSTITSIICEVVPDMINKSNILAKHFSKFGEVTRVFPNNKKKTAIIHFKDHKGAKLAKSKGKMVNPALPPIGHIFYSQSSPGSKNKTRTKRSSRSEVDDELEAMGGGSGSSIQFDTERPKPLAKKKIFSITKALNAGTTSEPITEVSGVTDDPPQASRIQGASEPPSRIQGASELIAVMKQQTFSDGDRWSVLEARDKYVRLKLPKKVLRSGTEIQDVNLVGTCPDFCPEKERYGRSAKNQLRWSEKDCGKLNHLAAVKEHSRSAADQDVPLSHELRPAAVLSKTMDYLMCNMVDRIDNMVGTMSDWFQFIDQLSLQNLLPSDPMSQFYVLNPDNTGETVGDWFEFMWSVTRAIRKDVTQQNLSDLTALSIVEKCARFHIFCGERLCEEDAHSFDKKLNDENLTKCLRTLKHMYYDLSLEGIPCPRENEFRAYDVLMNLNEGDTLREVQTLSEDLRTDPNVQFSLKCLSALNNQNYVLFFKMVKKATHLQACILKRYFYQVRRQALETIQRAFTPGKGMINFPTQKIVDWLGFESIAECGRFIRLHGIEYEDEVVFLERNTFVYPDTAPPMFRSRILIGEKKTVSFGEIMNGGPLADNPYLDYFPHDSFDDNGFLKLEAYEAKDQEVTVSPEELEQMQREEERKKEQAEFALEMVQKITKEFCEIEAQLICENVLLEAKNEKIAAEFVDILEKECVDELIDGVVVDTLRKARNELIAKRMIDNEKAEEEAAAISEVVMDWVEVMVEEVGREEMMEVAKSRKLQKYLVLAEKVAEDLIKETVGKDVSAIAETALMEAETEKEEKIRIFQNRLQKNLMRKVFKEWRRLASKSARQKAAVQNFPSGVADLSCEEQNARLGWTKEKVEQKHHLSIAALVQGRQDLDMMVRAREMEESLRHSAVLEPFQLLDWLKESASNKQDNIKWKLLLTLPEIEDDSSSRPFLEMLKRKFRASLPDCTKADLLVCHTAPHWGKTVSVCVREVGEENIESITCSEQERKAILGGTSAIMFVFLDMEETVEQAKARLEALLVNRPRIPPVPLAVLSSIDLGQTSAVLDLQRFVASGLISTYDVFTISQDIFDITQTVRLAEAVKQLILKTPEDPVKMLTIKPLNDYIEDFLTSQVFSEFYSNLKSRRSKDLLHRPACDLITLYNSALDHLVDTVQDLELQEVSWPAQEFSSQVVGCDPVQLNWNDIQYINSLVVEIEALKLPEMCVLETDRWSNLVEQVLVYLDKITVPEVDSSVVVSSITRAMAKCYRSFMTRCCSQLGGVESVPPPELLPWTDLVHSCVMYKLATLECRNIVCYREHALQAFSFPAEWLGGLGWGGEHTMDTMQEVVDTTVLEAKERSFVEHGESCFNKELKESLKEEQNQSGRFERMLEDVLSDTYIPSQMNLNASKAMMKTAETEDDVTSDDSENSKDLSTSQFVPLISYLSPTLGRLVSPYHLLTRQEVPRTGMSPRYSRGDSRLFSSRVSASLNTCKRKAETSPGSNKKSTLSRRLSLSPSSRPLRMDLDQKLDTLKVGLSNDREQNMRIEKMLQAALK